MSKKNIVVGIDFDNTLVCYDDIFYQVASEKGLIPDDTAKNKESVRNYLRRADKEESWTEIQGYVYGARMSDVSAFPGALECIRRLKASHTPVVIISHKTRHPYRGEAYDLHAAAWRWLESNGVLNCLSSKDIFFMETKEGKLLQIGASGCTHFIDDLPEFLAEPTFPGNTKKILFSPQHAGKNSLRDDAISFEAWSEIAEYLFSQ